MSLAKTKIQVVDLSTKIDTMRLAIKPALKWMNANGAPQELCDELQAALLLQYAPNTACTGLATPSAMDEGLAQNANQ